MNNCGRKYKPESIGSTNYTNESSLNLTPLEIARQIALNVQPK